MSFVLFFLLFFIYMGYAIWSNVKTYLYNKKVLEERMKHKWSMQAEEEWDKFKRLVLKINSYGETPSDCQLRLIGHGKGPYDGDCVDGLTVCFMRHLEGLGIECEKWQIYEMTGYKYQLEERKKRLARLEALDRQAGAYRREEDGMPLWKP